MALGINGHFISGSLVNDPEVDVIRKEGGKARTVVTFGIVYSHPYDDARHWKQRRPQYANIRAYGKVAEAAAKYLTKGDEILLPNALRVQDNWMDKNTNQSRSKEFYEPAMNGLKYIRCKTMGVGYSKLGESVEEQDENE